MFKQTRFLGASVQSFTSNIGWNGEIGSLTVALVEDLSTQTTKYEYATHRNRATPIIYEATPVDTPDSFQELDTGTPVHFRFEDFYFNGILQSWEYKQGFDGFYYEVVVNSATCILQNIELIIGGFNGTVQGVSNLMNIYGYFENIAFGMAQVNEAGMPWPILNEGFTILADHNTISPYTGGVWFKDVRYDVSLTNLPMAPSYYRIQGNNVNAIDIISQLCQDSSYDYIVDLRYSGDIGIIEFRTVSRKYQPSLTLLKDFIVARTDASSKNRGLELRNEVSSAFVIGGQIERLYTTTLSIDSEEEATIWPYWGLNADGNCIIGKEFNDDHNFDVDSRQVNCIGVGATYNCSVGELRAALADLDSWISYICTADPTKATLLGIPNTFSLNGIMTDIWAAGKGNAVTNASTSKESIDFLNDNAKQENIQNLFTFVQSLAKDYYGRRFMVRVPFVNAKTEPDTERIVTSYEPSDGGYLSRADVLLGNQPLDLPALYKDIFTLEDGRYHCFVKYDNADSYDLKELTPDVAAVVDNKLYLKCEIEPYLVYLDAENYTSPRVVITLPGPINNKLEDSELWGQAALVVKGVMRANGSDPMVDEPTADEIQKAKKICTENGDNFAGQFPVDFGPFANLPHYACVALRSNIETYGPWFAIGPQGKVRFEQDPELVPWNFNGYTYLDNAGRSKVIDVTAAQEAVEVGTLELVGAPEVQLGDALVAGGPNITGIDVSTSVAGVTTSYRMRTFTPVFGGFAKYNADKFQRLSRTARDNERKALENAKSVNSISPGYFVARQRALITQNGPKGVKISSPHPVIGAQFFEHANIDDASGIAIATGTLQEGVRGIKQSKYKQQALMSLDGLIRPYSTSTSGNINHFELTAWTGFIDVTKLNAFNYSLDVDAPKVADVEIASYGDDIPQNGMQSIFNLDESNVRLVGFKGPMILTGWGYDLFGKPVPNSYDAANNGRSPNLPLLREDEFEEGFKQKSWAWKTGPINLRWNDFTKVWDTPNKLFAGKMIREGGSGFVEVYSLKTGTPEATKIRLPLTDWLNTAPIPSGTKLVCGIIDDVLTVISADC